VYEINIEFLSLAEAEARYGMQMPVEHIATNLGDDKSIAIEFKRSLAFCSDGERISPEVVCEPDCSGRDDEDPPTLFIWTRSDLCANLPALAASRLDCYNEHSADLMHNSSYMEMSGGGIKLRVNLWLLKTFPGKMTTRLFRIVLVSAEQVIVATHRLDADEMDGLMVGFQACCSGSAINYNPYRIYSMAELGCFEGLVDVLDPSIITAGVATLTR